MDSVCHQDSERVAVRRGHRFRHSDVFHHSGGLCVADGHSHSDGHGRGHGHGYENVNAFLGLADKYEIAVGLALDNVHGHGHRHYQRDGDVVVDDDVVGQLH